MKIDTSDLQNIITLDHHQSAGQRALYKTTINQGSSPGLPINDHQHQRHRKRQEEESRSLVIDETLLTATESIAPHDNDDADNDDDDDANETTFNQTTQQQQDDDKDNIIPAAASSSLEVTPDGGRQLDSSSLPYKV